MGSYARIVLGVTSYTVKLYNPGRLIAHRNHHNVINKTKGTRNQKGMFLIMNEMKGLRKYNYCGSLHGSLEGIFGR